VNLRPANELEKLCAHWWERLADSTKGQQHHFAERFLELLGWQEPTPIAVQALAPRLSTMAYILRGSGTDCIAACFVMPGALEPPTSVQERGVDFCETTRILVNAAQALRTRFAFITDMHRSFLYDAQTEEILLFADTPEAFRGEMEEVLQASAVHNGSLEQLRRQPRSYAARQLREWVQRWEQTIANQGRLPQETASLSLDRLIVLQYLVQHDILKRSGWRMQKRFGDLLARAMEGETNGTGRALTSLWHDVWMDWKAELFAPMPALDEVIARDEITGPLLREFAFQSRGKFAEMTVLEMFNHGDAAEKARVRTIPEPDEERMTTLAKQTVETIDECTVKIDLADEGYRSIFYWFDQLTAVYDRLEYAYDMQQQSQTPRTTDEDLFAWSERDAGRPGALGDKLQYAVEHGLVVYYGSPRQLRVATLILYLHIIHRYERAKVRFTRFPALEQALQERPKFLDSDRRSIFLGSEAMPEDNWDTG